MHAEPFGPVDTIVVVDTEDELLAAMNASNGALVASLACDDEELAAKLAVDLQAFKVGINKPRSRGDRDEPFGGRGASWKGAFVGGDLLVHAVTVGEPGERLYGNFPDYSATRRRSSSARKAPALLGHFGSPEAVCLVCHRAHTPGTRDFSSCACSSR